MWKKILQSRAGHGRQHGACALHAGYLRLQTHPTQDTWHLLLLHCYNGCRSAPRCYVTRKVPVLLQLCPRRRL